MKKIAFIILMAVQVSAHSQIDNNLTWKCQLTDQENLLWTSDSVYRLKAQNSVYDACKNESKSPASCKKSNINCDSFINGISTTPMWQCTALDKKAYPWVGNISPQRDDAALSAKAKCMHHSVLPDTCYTHLLTCTNKNEIRRW